ncbi:MAG: hypothetical protein V3U80_09295 [Flavobacteriaceae bacterium]
MKQVKTIFKAVTLISLFTIFQITFSSCSDDDDQGNDDQCTYQGFAEIPADTSTSIPEADLTTDFFYTSSNGPEVEIYENANPGDFHLVTTTVTAGSTGPGQLQFNGTLHTVTVECIETGSAVGDSMRFKTSGSVNTEFCVVIDVYH